MEIYVSGGKNEMDVTTLNECWFPDRKIQKYDSSTMQFTELWKELYRFGVSTQGAKDPQGRLMFRGDRFVSIIKTYIED